MATPARSAPRSGSAFEAPDTTQRRRGIFLRVAGLGPDASGPSPATLKKIPRRLCVVSGASKALPLLGALRAGVATDLVLDDGAAHELLDLVHTRMSPRRSYI